VPIRMSEGPRIEVIIDFRDSSIELPDHEVSNQVLLLMQDTVAMFP
jgi:hypothetical protein